jgi:hypothetical protein
MRIRVVPGAARGNVVGLVLCQTMRPIVAGIAIGLVAAMLAVQIISSMLFGISALTPIILATATVVLVLSASIPLICPWGGRREWIRWWLCGKNSLETYSKERL